ncbi:conjugal transfer protein TrbI [aff. Roholtiella sp. LEGE 12411]|uniref:conjugal transfer protein TrbI n=1 Tax=aff. Roholtiella sp. LEGE 12411 TaxID=1828822 RepID=UPI00188002BD|nr:conjugal transfer protein TrbI [aff. Roholtiella sp. LEGE 12411]MBE9034080.1 conjugal transfer protein TrbI [aff. Roholtiella sp. LEGE 12411]
MTHLLRWKSGTVAFMTMAIATSTITPMIAFAPANAQYNIGQSRTVTIPANVSFPVTYEKDKVVVTPGESLSITLKIANDIIDRNRNVLIPAGTEVVGRLEPVNLDSYSRDRDYNNRDRDYNNRDRDYNNRDRDYNNRDRDYNNDNNRKGVRFVAQELVFSSGQRQQINATSRTYTRTEKISKGSDTGSILTDAAIGAGAASVISLITGNRRIEVLEPIIGGAAGAAASVLLRKKEATVFVLRPEQDLRLTLNSNLNLVPYRY